MVSHEAAPAPHGVEGPWRGPVSRLAGQVVPRLARHDYPDAALFAAAASGGTAAGGRGCAPPRYSSGSAGRPPARTRGAGSASIPASSRSAPGRTPGRRAPGRDSARTQRSDGSPGSRPPAPKGLDGRAQEHDTGRGLIALLARRSRRRLRCDGLGLLPFGAAGLLPQTAPARTPDPLRDAPSRGNYSTAYGLRSVAPACCDSGNLPRLAPEQPAPGKPESRAFR